MDELPLENEKEVLLKKESKAKMNLVFSFMFGVFFLTTGRDYLTADESGLFRLILIVVFLLLTIYFYLQSSLAVNKDEVLKIDTLNQTPEGEEGVKESGAESYLKSHNLGTLKKIVYIAWLVVLIILVVFGMLFGGNVHVEEPTDEAAKADTTDNTQ